MFYVAVVVAVVLGILALIETYGLFLTWRDRGSYERIQHTLLQVVSDICLLSEQNPFHAVLDKRLMVGHLRASLSMRVDRLIKAGQLFRQDRLLFDQLCEQIWGNVYFTELPERLLPIDGKYRKSTYLEGKWQMVPTQEQPTGARPASPPD